jgi:hypothetical protein
MELAPWGDSIDAMTASSTNPDEQAHLVLTINPDAKPMPYPGIRREDGSANHGFTLLKGVNAVTSTIPETQNEPALAGLITALNAQASPLFSIGCDVSTGGSAGNWWKRGYVEFSLDSLDAAADARESFMVFFRFDRFLNERHFDQPVQFHWELEGNAITGSGEAFHSIVCWITTEALPTHEQTAEVWEDAVAVLNQFISAVKSRPAGRQISDILRRVGGY